MTIVRPSIVFGPSVDNYISRTWQNSSFLPIPDGVDEEFQLIHEDDVVSALSACSTPGPAARSTSPPTAPSPGASPRR